jgi:NAD(P)-dependent dehydrogenase (short-subunit alcohol dehydrogenase family)
VARRPADGAVDRVAATAPEVLGSVDLLVNNAGNVRAGRLEDHDVADVRAMIDLNLTAPILLTRGPCCRRFARVPSRHLCGHQERSGAFRRGATA